MKVTKREQILIGALLIMLLGYSYYNFIYTKQVQKVTELKASRDAYSQKWEQVKSKIASKDKKNEQNIILNNKIINKADILFSSIEQEEIIVVLDKMIKDSKLKAQVLDFTEVSRENATVEMSKTEKAEDKEKNTIDEFDKLVSDFNGTTVKDDGTEKTNTDTSNITGAYKMQVAFNFKGVYAELISFIEQVENYNKKIIVYNINLTTAEASDLSGTIILDFYGIPKFNGSGEFKWDYKEPIGKENPFVK
jgi:type IV pilus assembly protein PilO